MKLLLVILMLALAAVAIPATSAAVAAPCYVNQSNDTVCHAEAAGCSVDTYSYDVEDALNQYTVDCWGCGAHLGGGDLIRDDCYTPPPIASSTAALPEPELPIETHCWSAEFGSGCATTVTTDLVICTYSSWTSNEGYSSSDLSCSNTTVGYCSVGLTPVQNPPNVWCENYQPPGDESAARAAPPGLPCYTGIAGSWCTVGALDCKATVGYQTGSASYQYARTYCGPELWSPCEHIYVDTTGEVRSCLVAVPDVDASASQQAPAPCQSGFGASWCTVTAGPCRATIFTFTAWGDRSAHGQCDTDAADCAFAGGVNLMTGAVSEGADCAPESASPATAAAEVPPQVCINGMAQTWCDVTVGPCDLRIVPWTAWGDKYVVADCQGGGAGPTCHTEVHTLPPDHEHWCAF